MSTELQNSNGAVEQQLSASERREMLYDSVEQKISVLKTLWNTAQGLTVPTPHDSNDLIDLERQQLEGVFQNALKLPIADSYKRLLEVASLIGKVSGRTASGKKIIDEYQGPYKGNDNVDFIESLKKGIAKNLADRHLIRGVMRDLGDKWDDPYEMEEWLRKNMPSIGDVRIEQVVAQRFSISLVINSSPPESISELDIFPERTFGRHIKQGVFSLVYKDSVIESLMEDHLLETINRMTQFFDLETGKSKDGMDISRVSDSDQDELRSYNRFNEQIANIHRHEDFHSFAEGYASLEGKLLLQLRAAVDIDKLKKQCRSKSPKQRSEIPKTMQRAIHSSINSNHEELTAEFAAGSNRDNIPSYTFANRVEKLQGILDQTLLTIRDTQERERIQSKLNRVIDPYMGENLRKRIDGLYRKIKESAPEKREDLDIVFALFPPTKIRHIENLVERWCQKAT